MKTAKHLALIVIGAAILGTAAPAPADELTTKEQLGKLLFFDTNLSSPAGQACATCHAPEAGWTASESELNFVEGVYHGAIEMRFGNRKAPSSAYADAPLLELDENGRWHGGLFWDGRATGLVLGDPLAEQAMGPFLNPVEQHIPHAKQVILKVKRSAYADFFEQVWGPGSLDPKNVELTYERIARSVAAYERSPEVNPFDSKYDYWLNGEAQLTDQEELGRQLFNAKRCNVCHVSGPGPEGEPPLFTNFGYANIGFPKNPNNPFYSQPKKINPDGADWVDYGLGAFLASAGFEPAVYEPQLGKHKIPTLRNVDKRPTPDFVRAYGHNGVFKSLEQVVHFYNTRDVADWPAPEVTINLVGAPFVGNLGLTADEEAAIVAFLKTLSDGYDPD
jgi:cytochrome c peroxidase